MGLSSEIASAAIAMFTAVAVGLIVDDFKEWVPRIVDALIDRAVPGELKIFFFAISRIGDGADRQDDFDHSLMFSAQTRLKSSTPN